jgi:hypothetical protein
MTAFYPVHVEAHIDPRLSRWQWLFKWLLALPHYLVLAFLWVAFVILSVVAFFAILFTGRYPRGVFDFNVGVLRWTWRVAYYAYGALGTDRYPPFSLDDVADYPARLQVDYPEHLSRGLVLVKWWLLAIPHYLVVGLFLGGLGWATADAARSDTTWPAAGLGLIGLLVLFAAVVLLVRGRYPRSIFDLVLGLNRWVLRVAAYAALMTDAYPPFRLDQGGDDPAVLHTRTDTPTAVVTVPPDAVAPPAAPATGHGWTAGRIVAVVVGSVVLLGALGVGLAGGALTFLDRTQRDSDGFLMSGTTELTTGTYAVTSTNVVLETGGAPTGVPERLLGEVKVTVRAVDGPVFVGIAATADVDAYLRDVGHATLTDYTDHAVYETSTGGAPSTAPTAQEIWVAQAAGTGRQQLVWPVEDGDWTVVLMNADGSSRVTGDVAVGATVPVLDWLGPTLLAGALVGTVLGVVLVGLALRRA